MRRGPGAEAAGKRGSRQDGMAVFGDTLRQARAYKGVTLKEAEQATRINRHHLAALEDENFGVLPPLIYQRGIVRNYATYLELDPGKLLAMFDEARGGEATAELVAAVKPLDMPNHWAPNFAIIAFMVVMSAIVFAWTYSVFMNPDDAGSPASPPPPTVTPLPEAAQDTFLTPTAAPPEIAARQAPAAPTVRVISQETVRGTSTPVPTPRAVATSTPRATATATAVPPTPEPVVEAPPVVEPTAPVVEEQAAAQDGLLTISITATADIYLEFYAADGTPLYSGVLTAGASTGSFAAVSFYGTTSDVANTLITNEDTGTTFNPQFADFSLP